MNKILLILLVVVIIAAGVIYAQRPTTPENTVVVWQYDLTQASEIARKENKPLMIDFYTDWCHWCKTLDENTYTDKEVIKLANKFVCVKIDADKHRDLVSSYGVTGYPHIIFLNSNLQEVTRVRGYKDPQRFLVEMQDALDRSK